jgi:hypothetical protein
MFMYGAAKYANETVKYSKLQDLMYHAMHAFAATSVVR